MVSQEEAINILEEENTPVDVIEHCRAVARKAMQIANKIHAAGHKVDLMLVESGALLHDIGRSQSHGIEHGYKGGLILSSRGLDREAKIAERHVGSGLTKADAKRFLLPLRDYLPVTIEEKIVCIADKQLEGTHVVSIWTTMQALRGAGVPEEAIDRLRHLYSEIETLSVSA